MNAAIASAEPPADDRELDLKLAYLPRNDYGNARRLIARRGRDMMYVHGNGWYHWDGTRWREDRGGHHMQRFAHETAMAIQKERDAVEMAGPEAFFNEKAFHSMLESLKKWKIASGNGGRTSAMIDQAAPYLERTIDQLDAHPYLINVANGTIDFSGEQPVLRRHRREDMITCMATVEYRPEAGAGIWRAFLDNIMPEQDRQTFLQRYFGCCLTGDMREQKLLLCHGVGANGKSTLANAMRKVFGDYCVTLPFETFRVDEMKRGSEASPDLAEIPGKRLIFVMEPENNVRLSPSMIKRFTGDEPIRARKLNERFMEFKLQAKLALAFNEKPIIPGQDDGTWRRPMLLGFDQQIPPEKRDGSLGDKLAAEASGILNWLIDGFLEWREKGLAPPESVTRATQDYRLENDNLGQFMAECTEKDEGGLLAAAELYKRYAKWCDANGIRKPLSATKFGTLLPQRGYKKRVSGTVSYEDLRLKDEEPTYANKDAYFDE